MQVSCRFFPIFSAATRRGHSLAQAPVPARVSAGQAFPRLAITAGLHRGRRVSAPKLLLLLFACTFTTAARCLTPRSSGAPTAGHQARSGGTRYIFTALGLASCRCRPLSSNVRQRRVGVVACRQTGRPSSLVFAHLSLSVAGFLPLLLNFFSRNSAGPQPRPSASASPRERGPSVSAACHHRRRQP